MLLGDPAQLKAIGAGDAYRGLLETHPSASLETIRRQVEPWQQQASEHLAAGRYPSEYKDIAHGYAVTIHKNQGATVDRTYALVDPLMDRHAAYVAMTRHRESVHLYANRETFTNRHHLDRALSILTRSREPV